MEKLVAWVVVCSLWASNTVAQSAPVRTTETPERSTSLNHLAHDAKAPELRPESAAISGEEQYKQLKLEYESIDVAAPALGVVVSAGAIVGGPVLIGLGELDGPFFDESRTPRGKGMMAGGAILLTAGFVGLVASSVFLRRNAQRRRELRGRMGLIEFRSGDAASKASR